MKDTDKYDTSNYPKDHKFYSGKYYKQLGIRKDKTGGIRITEFVGLRATLQNLM